MYAELRLRSPAKVRIETDEPLELIKRHSLLLRYFAQRRVVEVSSLMLNPDQFSQQFQNKSPPLSALRSFVLRLGLAQPSDRFPTTSVPRDDLLKQFGHTGGK